MNVDTRKIRLVMDLRRAGISDTRLLAAMERVPRQLFVPESLRDQAYANTALPIGYGQTVSQPLVVALMTQALDVGPRSKVLEVGTGSGYQAAVLAHLCRRVYTVERQPELLKAAEARFARLRLHNITTRRGDGSKGWPEQAPFDRIIVTAAADAVPEGLAAELGVGGLMVLPVGNKGRPQELVRARRTEDGLEVESLGAVRFVPLISDSGGGPRSPWDIRAPRSC